MKNRVDERTIIEIIGHEIFNMSIYYARSDDETKLEALEMKWKNRAKFYRKCDIFPQKFHKSF